MNEKVTRLLEAITAKTTQGSVEWETVVSETYRASLGGGLIRVTEYPNGHIAILISNSTGGQVFLNTFSPSDLGWRVAVELFKTAQNAALRVDDTLDQMIESLSIK